MSDETPGNAAGANTSSSPPDAGSPSNSGVTDTSPASSPGTSTASPSVASPPGSSTGTGEASPGEAFDFGAIFDAPPEIPAVTPEVAPAAPQAPPVQTPPAPPPAGQQQAEGQVAPSAQPAPTPGQALPQGGGLDTFDPSSLSQHLAANEDAAVQFTAENMFKLSPEEVEALETNMAEAVPRLMARAFVKSQLNALSQMARIVPAMIQRQTEMLKRNSDNETRFYGRWPDIKADKHGDMVRKYAAVYRQMHPNTTLEQMIEDLGPMVMMAARVVPQVGGQAANPVSRPSTTNGRAPPPPPFVPAGSGATNASRAPELNPVEVMFQDQG
jgi:hypothetical protein